MIRHIRKIVKFSGIINIFGPVLLSIWYFLYPKEHTKITETETPNFAEVAWEGKILFPGRLYEIFRGTKPHLLFNVQSLCALNIFIG